MPGLNDSHLHLIRGGLNYKRELRREGAHAHARDRARKSAVPIGDFSGFRGTLGCSCSAFQQMARPYLEMRRMAEASRVKQGLRSLSVAA